MKYSRKIRKQPIFFYVRSSITHAPLVINERLCLSAEKKKKKKKRDEETGRHTRYDVLVTEQRRNRGVRVSISWLAGSFAWTRSKVFSVPALGTSLWFCSNSGKPEVNRTLATLKYRGKVLAYAPLPPPLPPPSPFSCGIARKSQLFRAILNFLSRRTRAMKG